MHKSDSTKKTIEFNSLLRSQFPFEPTGKQKELFAALSTFLFEDSERSAFVLKGYAGTGKTTVLGALVRSLPSVLMRSFLLAPTGRAAKVMAGYAGKPAYTIHKKIYVKEKVNGVLQFVLMKNLHKRTLFIVDEASMISFKSGLKTPYGGERNLLDDLVKYVYSGEGCKLILVGDGAQLPPVMEVESKALDADFLNRRYSLNVREIELTEVTRQLNDSGILFNSFQIRNQQEKGTFPALYHEKFDDVSVITGYDLQDELDHAIGRYGVDNCMVITRSNKRANLFNLQIRSRILWFEEEVSAGDLLMVVKNNYYWLDDKSKAGFIANGDIIEILKVVKEEARYEQRFLTVICKLIDYPEEPELEVKLLMGSLMVESANLPRSTMKEFYYEVEKDYLEFSNKRVRTKKILDDPYFNALQVKFAYAVTCHKSQGGQWPVVFIDQGYLTEEMLDKEYLRWLYTAVTRAQEEVYFVNFNKQFFPEGVE